MVDHKCPGCDVQHEDDPLVALALGAALGAHGGMHHVTELMCRSHRTAYVLAMLKAMKASEATPGPGEEP